MRKRLIERSVERERADRNRWGPPRAIGLMAFAIVLTVGCVSPPDGIEVVRGRELDDIPVKSNFEFVESELYAPPLAKGTNFRSWTGLYRGRGLREEIGPWYVRAMKDHGWTFTGTVEAKGSTSTYNFVKRDEAAVIRVYRKYSGASGGSVNMVRAEVHPRSTESFRPEDFETWKASGVAWTEPREDLAEEQVQVISFSPEIEAETTQEPSGFLLDESGAKAAEELEEEPGGTSELQ